MEEQKKAKELQPKGLPCGIYFGLSDYAYRKDPALNFSGLKQLRESATEYWKNSSLNPQWKPQRPTPEMQVGTAMHVLLLEPDEFSRRYAIMPGEPFDDQKQIIRLDDYEWMTEAVKELSLSHPSLETLIKNGGAEVVIIWEDPRTGIRMKAKHDYWKPFCSVDYKTSYSVTSSSIKSAFWKYGYHMQAYHYVESRRVIRDMLNANTAKVYNCADMKMIDRFLRGEEHYGGYVYMDNFVFIFQTKEFPYTARVLEISDMTMLNGEQEATKAIDEYVYNMEKFGPDNIWRGQSGKIETLDMNYGIE